MSTVGKKNARFYEWRDEVLRKLASHPKVTSTAYKIASLILIRVNIDTRKAYPSVALLVKESGETRITVMRSLKALRETGHVKWELAKAPKCRQPVNHYEFVLIPPPTSITNDTSSEDSTSITGDTSPKGRGRVAGIIRETSSTRATGIIPDPTTSIICVAPTGITGVDRNLKGNHSEEPSGAGLQAPAPFSDGYRPPSCTPPDAPLERRRADDEFSSKAREFISLIEGAERDAQVAPDLVRPSRSSRAVDEVAAFGLVKTYPTSPNLLADANFIRSCAKLDVADVDLSTDAPVVMEVAEMLSRDDPEPNLPRAALEVHRRAWLAHRILLALADTIENAESICGTNKADLYADDEVPF